MPKESETWLVQQVAEDIFGEFPLLHMPSLLESLRQERQPSTGRRERSPAWDCCFNAVIAIAVPIKTLNSSFVEVGEFAWAFFKNAYALFPELILHGDNLLAVQAILVMAMFARGSADTRLALLLLSTAIRISHTIGLHKRRPSVGSCSQDATEAETRSRVFWTAYILDVEMSVNCGLPSIQPDEEDVELDLPFTGPLDVRESTTGTDVFRARAELAIVQSMVKKRLYSAKALRRTGSQLAEAMELETVLLDWRSGIPVQSQPDYDSQIANSVAADASLMVLHLVYYNCLSIVHWAAIRGGAWEITAGVATAQPELLSSVAKCRAAARSTIHLLTHRSVPRQFVDFW